MAKKIITSLMIRTMQNISSAGTVRALSNKSQHKGALHQLRDQGYVEYACINEWWGYWPTDTGKELIDPRAM